MARGTGNYIFGFYLLYNERLLLLNPLDALPKPAKYNLPEKYYKEGVKHDNEDRIQEVSAL